MMVCFVVPSNAFYVWREGGRRHGLVPKPLVEPTKHSSYRMFAASQTGMPTPMGKHFRSGHIDEDVTPSAKKAHDSVYDISDEELGFASYIELTPQSRLRFIRPGNRFKLYGSKYKLRRPLAFANRRHGNSPNLQEKVKAVSTYVNKLREIMSIEIYGTNDRNKVRQSSLSLSRSFLNPEDDKLVHTALENGKNVVKEQDIPHLVPVILDSDQKLKENKSISQSAYRPDNRKQIYRELLKGMGLIGYKLVAFKGLKPRKKGTLFRYG